MLWSVRVLQGKLSIAFSAFLCAVKYGVESHHGLELYTPTLDIYICEPANSSSMKTETRYHILNIETFHQQYFSKVWLIESRYVTYICFLQNICVYDTQREIPVPPGEIYHSDLGDRKPCRPQAGDWQQMWWELAQSRGRGSCHVWACTSNPLFYEWQDDWGWGFQDSTSDRCPEHQTIIHVVTITNMVIVLPLHCLNAYAQAAASVQAIPKSLWITIMGTMQHRHNHKLPAQSS